MDVSRHYVGSSTPDWVTWFLVSASVATVLGCILYSVLRPEKVVPTITALAVALSFSSVTGIVLSIRDFTRFPQGSISYGVGVHDGWFFTQSDLDAASLKNYGVTLHGVRFFGAANGSIVQATARDDKGVATPVVIRVHDPVTREGVRMTVYVQDAGRELPKVDDDSKTRGQDTVDKS